MTTDPGTSALQGRLELLRRAEKEQALFYRALAARAEETEPLIAHRFHDPAGRPYRVVAAGHPAPATDEEDP